MRPVRGLASTSSGRSMGVAPSTVRSRTRLHQHVALITEPGRAFSGPSASCTQRQPAPGAIRIEACHIQRAAIEQSRDSHQDCSRIELRRRHKFVDVLELVVVAHVDGDATILRNYGLAPSCAKRPSAVRFDRRALRIVRIDLDDPAETEGSCGSCARSKRASVTSHALGESLLHMRQRR